jgi:YebC/PmpR family DNA-binding regulatory protein
MSGHSKWAQIKRQKASNDQQRSGVFSKMSRLITIAVHEGGGITDPEKNFKLRLAIERAKLFNMPKDTIQRAINKAAGGGDSMMREVIYEAFGQAGIALMIAATTDNSNRTHAEIKHVLDMNGGKIGGPNAVAHLFQKCAVALFDKSDVNEQAVFDFAQALDAYDIEDEENEYTVYIPFENLGRVKDMNVAEPREVDVFFRPLMPVTLDGPEEEKLHRLIEKLEELDDVHNVYSNAA